MKTVRDIAITLAALVVAAVGIWTLFGKRLPSMSSHESVPDHPTAAQLVEWGTKCGNHQASQEDCEKFEAIYQTRIAACQARIGPKDLANALAMGPGHDSPADVLQWCEQRFPDLR